MNITTEHITKINQLFQELKNNLNGISDYCNLKDITIPIDYKNKEYPIDVIEKWANEAIDQINNLENLFDICMGKSIKHSNNAKLENCITAELPISTYLKYFGKEKIEKIEFLPLIDYRELGQPICGRYDIDYNKFNYEERIKLLFNFFSFNVGEKVEIGTIFGLGNCILAKSTFIVGGRIEQNWIKPMNIIYNDYCYDFFVFDKIYYAKVIVE